MLQNFMSHYSNSKKNILIINSADAGQWGIGRSRPMLYNTFAFSSNLSIAYYTGRQIANCGPNVACHSVFSDLQKHSGKSENLKFPPTSHSKYWCWDYKSRLASTPTRRHGPKTNAVYTEWPPSKNNCPPLAYNMNVIHIPVYLNQWSSTWAKLLPRRRFFMRCGGDFVIWEAISLSRGAISAGGNTKKFWIDKIIFVLWNQSIWCIFDSMVNNKSYKTHQTDHVEIKLTSFCVSLHCTNYPRPLRFSLTGNQALRLLQRLWMFDSLFCCVKCSK